MRLILGWWLILTVAVAVTVTVMPGIEVDWSPGAYLLTSAVFAVVNVTLGTLLRLVSLPLILLTLGLFSLVLNAVLLLVTDWLLDSLEIDSFWAAVGGAISIALVTVVVGAVVQHGGSTGKMAAA